MHRARHDRALMAVDLEVLHVAQPLDAGVPQVASQLVADQLERGWRVGVAAAPDSDLMVTARALGLAAYEWPAIRDPGPVIAAEARELSEVIAAARPRIVHLHSAKAGLAGRLTLRGRLPTVFQPHAWSFEAARGAVFHAARAWEVVAARWADRIVCVSGDELDRGRLAGVRGRYAVIPNGIDIHAWTPASGDDRRKARAALGMPDGPLVVSVGRLAPQKGHDILLRAWAAVRAGCPDATLALVGAGPDEPALRAGAGSGVHFAGHRRDIADWLAAADVVAVPSRWEAGLPLVAMEAMARQRSVVVSDVAGVRVGLARGGGAIVPVGDVAALAHEVGARLADSALAARDGQAGRRRVEAVYNVRVAAQRMADLYADLLRERRLPSARIKPASSLSRRT